jgi:hypothetical protein
VTDVPESSRRTSTGPGRLLIAVYAVFALAATGRSSVQLLEKAGQAPLPYALSALAAVVYVAATVGLAEVGPRPRLVAWVAVLVETAGVLVVGTLSLVESAWFPDDTVWSRFGSGYGWLPLVLPFLGLGWLLRTRPRRPTLSP